MRINTFPDVRPISDLRQNITAIMNSIDTEKRPVILTKHGYGKYVLLDLEDNKRITAGVICAFMNKQKNPAL